jgi:uncharacterized protein YndB with AHSA1/START domain
MANVNEAGIKAGPLELSRHFEAPRALVFQAWSTAEHVKRWFSPEGLSVPEAEVDFRPGGVFVVCMRTPDGQDFWSRGNFIELVPPERLIMEGSVTIGGVRRFTARTTVTFKDEGAGTLLSVHQEYEIFDAAFASAVEGSAEGWRTTLDKLEREVARMQASAVHATFSIEQTFAASPAQVFTAFSDPAAKARWFAGGEGYSVLERSLDVRPGGRERVSGRWANGTVSRFDAAYYDVVPNKRLVYAYEMHLDDRKISVSLATLEIEQTAAGTRLLITEQGVFLDGYDDAGMREKGTGMLMNRLAAALDG